MLNFDDQDGQIWYDGALRPWRSANLHVLTHGLHYGSCVFEGERVYNTGYSSSGNIRRGCCDLPITWVLKFLGPFRKLRISQSKQ